MAPPFPTPNRSITRRKSPELIAQRKPASVLFTIPNFITAGSGKAMLNIIHRLDRTRFAPAVCVSRKGGDLDREVESLGILFLETPCTVAPKPYLTLLPRTWRAAKAFRPHRFTLWHSFHYADDYTEPIIARMSGARAWVFTKKNMGWGSRAWRLRSQLATRIAAQNGDMMREFFGSRSFQRKTRLIPRGVDTARFSPAAAPVLGIRAKRTIPLGSVVTVCVAHLVPVKSHGDLLKATCDVPDLQLLIAGAPLDAVYAASLLRMADELGIGHRTHFLGSVTQVPALLAESDIFVLTSSAKGEGCPVALLEAMSCGKACVATRIPGSSDLIQHEGSGLLVPPGDSAALAAALRKLIASAELRRSLGQSARRRVVEQFGIEHEVASHESFYVEILNAA